MGNVGTGRGGWVSGRVNRCGQAEGVKLNYRVVGRREGDIVAIWAEPSYANTELGWRAERSLDDTLRAAWSWEKHLRGMA